MHDNLISCYKQNMWPKTSWKYIEGNCKCLVIHRYDYVSALKYFSHMFRIEVFLSSWRCQLIFLPPQSSLNTNKVGFEPSTPLKKENKKTPPSSDDNAMQHSGLITYTKSRKIFVSRKRKQLEKVGTCCGSTTKCSLIFLRKSRPFFLQEMARLAHQTL